MHDLQTLIQIRLLTELRKLLVAEKKIHHTLCLTFAVIKPTAFPAILIPPFKPVQIPIEDVRAILRNKVNASAAASY